MIESGILLFLMKVWQKGVVLVQIFTSVVSMAFLWMTMRRYWPSRADVLSVVRQKRKRVGA